MFRHLSIREQLMEEKRKNKVLQAHVKDLEDAVIELADVITENEEKEEKEEGDPYNG